MSKDPAHMLLLGNGGGEHVGFHLRCAAVDRSVSAHLVDISRAYAGPWLRRQWAWRIRGRRPVRLSEFSREVVAAAHKVRAGVLLTTGLAPLDASALVELRARGVRLLNFLTDDPWNPAHFAPWFMAALPEYDTVYSPRRANMADLARAGVRDVRYLAFAYNPDVHFPEPNSESADADADVFFAGGADADRLQWIEAVLSAGRTVALYGGYWERYPSTRSSSRGIADLATIRRAVARSKVSLCLVREANRDGHAMRTFELAAMRACMLVQRTEEHEMLFGDDGESVCYFRTVTEMKQRLEWLLRNPEERCRLADAVYRLVTHHRHTYADRLDVMLRHSSDKKPS